ncbi:hypothetical protein GCM10023184_29900 [Flaviaesturariibacter amylovorans]|uniref:Zf-HC2 domain-containing protein n=2 Tax=Flaviaesturariibacter amylovorans TaxID=1084520 RepID=A0ABP8H6S5_9BACT
MASKITCAEAVDYISRREEGKLTRGQRFRLWRHLAACSLCRIFSAQNKLLARFAAERPVADALTETDKDIIIQRVLGESQEGKTDSGSAP